MRLDSSRLSLSRQLLLLQMCIVVLVVTTVAGVSLVETDQAFRRDETRRMSGTAESVATDQLLRVAAARGVKPLETSLRVKLEATRVSAGASYVAMVAPDGSVLVASIPATASPVGLDAQQGASWSGTRERYGREAVEAQVPVLAGKKYGTTRPGDLMGYVVLGRFYPSRLEVLGTAAPSVFGYLAIATLIGVVGSLLLARRVKRQTLGLEPREITALVEQREAMLHGVREGVLGVDRQGAIAFANDEAIRLLRLQPGVLGARVDELEALEDVADVLTGRAADRDLVAAVGSRLLVLNSQPVEVRGRQTGWVTSMRDRTELLGLQHELAEAQRGTDTLRAQVHEFRNRLHAISGMAELGHGEELKAFVETVATELNERLAAVARRIEDPAVAALVVAKSSRAVELGITFGLADGAHLGRHDPQLSADLVTVVGNLVDNAFEAVDTVGGQVTMALVDDGERIAIEVRDSGRGVAEADRDRVFEVGWTTKPDSVSHGFGLALTRMACERHGGSARFAERGGAVVYAELFVDGAVDA